MGPQQFEAIQEANKRLSFEHYSGQHDKQLTFGCPECYQKSQPQIEMNYQEVEYIAAKRATQIQLAITEIDTAVANLQDMYRIDTAKDLMFMDAQVTVILNSINEIENFISEISSK